MQLNQEQAAAVDCLLAWWEGDRRLPFKLEGGAGTGKTTTIIHAVQALGLEPEDVLYAAPTGKAANVLARKTGAPATTLHRLLYSPDLSAENALRAQLEQESDPEEKKRLKKELAKLQKNLRFTLRTERLRGRLVVVDERSMVGKDIERDLLRADIPLLLVGDPYQLPPVKAKPGFEDVPIGALLTKVERTDAESILRAAYAARDGKVLPYGDWGEFKCVERGLPSEAYSAADMVLCGTNRTRKQINRRLRKHRGFDHRWPQKGERLICKRNNHDEGIMNGQLFTVVADPEQYEPDVILLSVESDDGVLHEELRVSTHRFDELHDPDTVVFSRHGINEFDFAYCITVHASQGSEWDNVFLLDDWNLRERDAWLYTGITRGRNNVTVVK